MKPMFVLLTVLIGMLPLPGQADERPFADCVSYWHSINEIVLRGEGQAQIAAQCRSHEKPCPARTELLRRAKLVSDAYALANLRAKVASQVSHEIKIVSGVGSDQLTMNVSGKVYDIVFCNEMDNEKMRTLVWGKVK